MNFKLLPSKTFLYKKVISGSVLLSLFNIALIWPNEVLQPEQSQQEQVEQQIDPQIVEAMLKEAIEEVIRNFEYFDRILELSIEIVNNNQLRNIRKDEVRSHIKMYREVTQHLKKQLLIAVQPQDLIISTIILHTLIKHFRIFVHSSFKKIETLPDIEQILKRHAQDDIDKIFELNKRLLVVLEHEAQNVGISKFNKFCRSIAKFSHDYNILPTTARVLSYGFIAALVMTKFNGEHFGIKFRKINEDGNEINSFDYLDKDQQTFSKNIIWGMIQRIKFALGEWPIISNNNQNLPPLNSKGTSYSKFSSMIGILTHELKIGNLDFPILFSLSLFNPLVREDGSTISNWISKKYNNIINYLQGKPQRNTDFWERNARYTFKDIIGNDHAKAVLMRIVDYIRDYEKFDRAGIAPEIGYVLAGDSRTGKTMMAEALAGELQQVFKDKGEDIKVNFLSISMSDIEEVEADPDNRGKSGVEIWFKIAKLYAPCVLFFDEIDMLRLQREHNSKKLSEFLTALSGYMTKDFTKQVFVLVATNKPENLDFALRQHGRLGKLLRFDYPTLEHRKEFIKLQLEKQLGVELSETFINEFAQELGKCSYDSMHIVIATALQKAKMRNSIVTEKDFRDALDEEIRNILPTSDHYTAKDEQTIAAHLAGHTLAALLLPSPQPILKVTMNTITAKVEEQHLWAKYEKDMQQEPFEYGKVFTDQEAFGKFKNQQDLMNECKTIIAGHIAEEILLGSSGYMYHKHDQSQALAMVKYIVFKGNKEEESAKAVRQAKLQEAENLLKKSSEEIRRLFIQNKDKLQRMMDALLEKRTLTGTEVKEIFEGKMHSEQQLLAAPQVA